uniref:Uncharacterized protein n=1 Tax=Brassica campestris TaxID=3711 RepID=M4EGM5_BRACM
MKSVRKKESQPRRSVHAKKRRVRGPLDRYVSVPPPGVLQERKDGKSTLGAACDKQLVPDTETQDKIMTELDAFKDATGIFGHDMAIRQRDIKAPASYEKEKSAEQHGFCEVQQSSKTLKLEKYDDLSWNVVSQAMGVEEPNYSTRGAGAKGASSSKTDKEKGIASSNQKQCYRPSARAMTLFDEKDELEEDLDEDDLGHEDVECDDEDENNGISEDEF